MTRMVDVEIEVEDSTDLSMLAYEQIGEGVVDVAGQPDSAGDLSRRVRITGTLTIEDAGPGRRERRRRRREQRRREAIERHALIEGATA